MLHVSYTVEGTWLLLKRHGWSWQQPSRRAIERDDHAVEMHPGVRRSPSRARLGSR
ncbi:winged helix-turn-helix domain-containing protein [Streptomyces sp. NK08204]|uniref:helix-turn-helix domain-containing protein n=1 Tax=Streptomyces sp. NK08204 TaxID=2873260 RepID=UPI0035A8885D